MWNKKLKNRLDHIEYRLRRIEKPHSLRLDQEVYGIKDRLSVSGIVILEKIKGKGTVVRAYRDNEGYPVYDIYIEGEGVFEEIKPCSIITKKPKKNEYPKT